MKKLTYSTVVSLLISLCFAGISFSDGSLHGDDTCPVPSITGITENIAFLLQGQHHLLGQELPWFQAPVQYMAVSQLQH